jgi:salicylate hydroxylase
MRIAVAGAGIAGLIAAIALARRGFSVEIFERAERLEEIGAGIQLSPNAMAVLDRLGLVPELAPALVEPEAIEIREAAHGRRLARLPLGATARARYGQPYALIRRADLQAALLRAALREPALALHLGTPLAPLPANAETGEILAGATPRRFDLVVAADGLNSRFRIEAFGHPGPVPLGRAAWRALLPADAVPPGIPRDVTGLWLGERAHLVHYPVAAGAGLNVVVIADPSASPAPPAARFGAEARKLVEAVPAWTLWPLFALDPGPAWTRGRLVLIGDAAHAMPPNTAQGGAQAIEDGFMLAACLAAGRDDPQHALAAYEKLRRPRVARIARESRRNMQVYHLSGFSALARNAAIRALPARLHLRRLDWLFAWSPPQM